ncbi:MAG: GMC oxidoreductase, partial [Thermoanaerobaculia bacterium]
SRSSCVFSPSPSPSPSPHSSACIHSLPITLRRTNVHKSVDTPEGGVPGFDVILKIIGKVFQTLADDVAAIFKDHRSRQDFFRSEDEILARMMCVAAMGRDAAIGRFRFGDKTKGDTALRVDREDGKKFHEDPIYDEIRTTLDRFARTISDDPNAKFQNPFVSEAAGALGAKSIGISHPLGGCRMAASVADGVCDGLGRVYDKAKDGQADPYYRGLYIADAAVIPTALGVNPSLTISALALQAAENIIAELPA